MKFFFAVAILCSMTPVRVVRAAETQVKVENPVKETGLTTVILTPQAEQRLRIATAPVTRKTLPAERLYPGEITLPLTGGIAGSLMALAPPQTPADLLKLAELQAAADGEAALAKVRLDAARVALERTGRLFTAQSASQRLVEEAQTALDLAGAAHEQAVTKRTLLGPGLAVNAQNNVWWVRVAVPSADTAALDEKAAARVTPLGAAPGAAAATEAVRVQAAPPSASALAGTVDWHFLLPDPVTARRPGERVEVRLALKEAGENLTVLPWAAVLHDIYGGQWVYERTAPHTFVRRRIQVARVNGADAVLTHGPAEGAEVVTDGAAEIFGSEFGPGK